MVVKPQLRVERLWKVDDGEAASNILGNPSQAKVRCGPRTEGASVMVPWIAMGDVKIKESDLLT